MHIRLLPEKWKAWLDREDRPIEACDGTTEDLVAHLSRDDLDFQEAQAGNGEFRISLAPDRRAIRTVQALNEIVRCLIERDEFGVTGYAIARGPCGSLDWEGAAPPPDLTEERLGAMAER